MTIFTPSELNSLADRLADDYLAHFGAEPVAPGARFDDDVLTFFFSQGLGEEEQPLREEKRLAELRERRERFLEPAGAHLVPRVEEFAHSRVAFHVGLFDPAPSATMMLFGFEDFVPDPEPEERRELLSWSAAVRGQARRLRKESVEAREAHLRIRAEFRARRAALAERFSDED